MTYARLVMALRNNAAHMRRAAKSGLVVTSGLLVMRIAAFVMSALVAHVAGAETLGEYTLFLTVFVLASEIPHAFDTAYLRAAGTPDGASRKGLYETANAGAKLVLLAVLAFVFASLSDVISGFFDKPVGGEIVAWAVLCGGLNSVFMLIPAIAQQRRDYWAVALLKPSFNLAVLALVSGGVALGIGLDIQAIFSAYFVVGAVLGVWALVIAFRPSAFDRGNSGYFRAYLSTAGVLLVSTALTLVGSRLDVFFLSYYLDFEQLGMYGVALRISMVMSVMTGVMATIMKPRAAEAAADPGKFRRYIALGGFYALVQVVIGLALLLVMGPLIHVTFGEGYADAVLPASILVVQTLAMTAGIPFLSLIQCGAKPSRTIYISLIKVFISVPLMMFLIPRYSVSGAALAVAITALSMTAMVAWMAIKHRPKLKQSE